MPTLNEIATLATRQQFKTSRSDAYLIITHAIEDGGVLSEYDMANLYSFFIPTTPKNKNDFQWVHSAITTTKDTRYYLKYVYVIDGEMVATDGHRMHIAETDLENGFYDKAGVKVEVDATFPNYKRVIPKDGTPFSWVAEYCEVIENGGAPLIYKLPNGAGVNKKYWDAATQGASVVDFDAVDKTSPIKIELTGSRFAVVMPMALPETE
jgi:hypothetical protein